MKYRRNKPIYFSDDELESILKGLKKHNNDLNSEISQIKSADDIHPQMFFEKQAMIVAYSMYIIGIIVVIIVAYFMKNKKDEENSMLLIELPEYKSPNFRTILIYV